MFANANTRSTATTNMASISCRNSPNGGQAVTLRFRAARISFKLDFQELNSQQLEKVVCRLQLVLRLGH